MSLTPREWSAAISAAFMAVGTLWYIVVAIKGNKVKPVLASWIVIGTTLSISFVSYLTTPNMSIVSNACNATSALSALGILIVLVALQINRQESVRFSQMQIWSLVGAAFIAAMWLVIVFGMKGTGILPNILMQLLMLIGYFFTVQKLWKAEKNTESMVLWSFISVSSLVAIYTSWVSDDSLALVYAGRSAICSGLVVVLMFRIEMRNNMPLRQWTFTL